MAEAGGATKPFPTTSILGARGFEPPDVSAWGYALATGRMTLKTMPTDA